MKVTDREFCARYVDWEEGFGASRQVLDVTVAAVFGATRNCASAFFRNLSSNVSSLIEHEVMME